MTNQESEGDIHASNSVTTKPVHKMWYIQPRHGSSRTVKVIDLPLPRSQDTAVIGVPKSNVRKQNYEILTETPKKKRLQRSDKKRKMKRRAEDIKQSQKK